MIWPMRVAGKATERASTLRSDRTSAALILLALAAWAIVLRAPAGMGVGLFVFLGAWTVMMVAMMLPSVAPFVLLYRRGASARSTAMLAMGYLAVWAAAGIPAYVAQELLPMSASPFALAVAGIYQLTPMKEACLQKCRSPADFLMLRWGRSALRLGMEHGAWCLGCCWALMAVLVIVGMMGLAWIIGLAVVVALEKLSPHGVILSRVAGAAFIVAALIQAAREVM